MARADENRIVVHAEHDDARGSVLRQHAARQFEAGYRRQVDINQTDVGMFGNEDTFGGFRVGRFEKGNVRLVGEHGAAAGRNDRMIIGDQNTHVSALQSRCCTASYALEVQSAMQLGRQCGTL